MVINMSKDNKQKPPPIPNYPPPLTPQEEERRKFELQKNIPAPLTPPQAERVRIIQTARDSLSKKNRFSLVEEEKLLSSFSKGESLNNARLSSLSFNEKEMEIIRKATIKAFEDDFAYEKSDKRVMRYPTQSPLDIMNSIGEVLANKQPPVILDERQKEELGMGIHNTYIECKNDYRDTHLDGVSKNKKEKVKTTIAMVSRMMEVAIGAVSAAIGSFISYTGKRDLDKGLKIEREAEEKIAKFDESRYEDYNNTEIDKLEKERLRGEEMQERGLLKIGIGATFYKGADLVESVRKKNNSVSNLSNSTISLIQRQASKAGGRSRN